jgi:predicted lipoprotein with Yx(FWY)xxD motif
VNGLATSYVLEVDSSFFSRGYVMNNRWFVPAGLAGVALIAAACGTSSTNSTSTASKASSSPSAASSPAAASTTVLKTTTIGGAKVLTNAKGFTVYWFAPDTATKSNCNGSCAHYWPPVKGPLTAGPGVTGKLATITRSDGSTQATYNGHPLYTYVSDTAPGQDKGNGLNLSGGVWHVVAASGTAVPAAHSSPSKSKSGGYGY